MTGETGKTRAGAVLRVLTAAALAAGLLQGAGLPARKTEAAGIAAAADESVSVTVDGRPAAWQVEPFLRDGSTFVALREAAVALGAEVEWNQASRTATLRTAAGTVVHRAPSSEMKVDGYALPMPAPSVTEKGTLMVPLRSLADALKATLSLKRSGQRLQIAIETDSSSFVTKQASAVDRYLQQISFSGIALVASKGGMLLRKGYGPAGGGKLNRPDRPSRIASLTKAFTAAAIMKLEEQGKLKLDDPVSAYIPGIPRGDDITIHMLLSHTSGLPSNFTRTEGRTLEDTIDEIRSAKLAFEPGTAYKYSNCGYVLLAGIIERLSGNEYGDVLKDGIFEPLGMANTGTATKTTPTIKGYVKENGAWKEAGYYVSQSGTGTLYSTVDDLLKWDRALYAGQVVSDSSLRRMYTPYSDKNYGYGWMILEEDGGGKTVFHNGSGTGYSTGIMRELDSETVVILLGNRAGVDTISIMTQVMKLTRPALASAGASS